MDDMLVANPLVLDPTANYTFHSYFELRFAPADILADLGCTLVRRSLTLPQSAWSVAELQHKITSYLPYISLTSEDARKQSLVAPLLLELAQTLQTPLQIEYPIAVNHYLNGEMDYYLHRANSLLVVEAKQADLTRGFVQLAVELIALNLWLARRQGIPQLERSLLGAVTTGDIWQFGIYDPVDQVVTQDTNLYRVPADLEVLAQTLRGILENP
jgi:hypothetical protein